MSVSVEPVASWASAAQRYGVRCRAVKMLTCAVSSRYSLRSIPSMAVRPCTTCSGRPATWRTTSAHTESTARKVFRCAPSGARSFFEMSPDPNQPAWKILDDESRLMHNRTQLKEPGGYLTDVFGNEACQFIEDNQDFPFFLYLSFNAVHTPLEAKEVDLNRFPQLEGKRQKLAAMTWSMDEAIGQVCDKLKDLGLEDNTIIIFTNDNGGTTYHGSNNSPFSGCKATYLEGGIRVPYIMKWKGQLKPGRTFDYPITTRDLVSTSIALAGGKSEEYTDLDGVDIMPYVQGKKEGRPHETLYWNGDGRFSAIREGDWKLISMPDRLPELYDLSKDISEKKNLAEQYPDLTKELLKKLFVWSNNNDNPRWQLQKKYEAKAIERFDSFRK